MTKSRKPQATETSSRGKERTPRELQATQFPTIRIQRPAHRVAQLRKDIEKLKRELQRLNEKT